MARVKSLFAFRPLPVTLLTIATYISLFAALLYIDRRPPPVADQREQASWGVDVDEAWTDLEVLTRQFHPYNSRPNDYVRQYLLDRIHKILSANGVPGHVAARRDGYGYEGVVEVFDDGRAGKPGSNVTFSASGRDDLTVYFEGTNIIVYIHGERPAEELSPVLVNAHYDSVSTGYGATDDGTAVVSVLQIIKSFTRPESKGGKRLKRGLIALLNNGEEDYLNGARAFTVHPIAPLPHAFLNLEGAGAGGRAMLFRSTDAEVTKYYKKAKRPLGTVVSGDGYKAGLIRSATDYAVFVEVLGMRGLDVAFYRPRSRYHTTEDDVRHSSKRSLWHMLGGSLATLRAMTDDTSRVFDAPDGSAGKGHDAVWFDVFGRAFSVFRLHTVFALTITLLVVPPVILLVTIWALWHLDKLYYFSHASTHPHPPDHSIIAGTIQGWRGLFRFPIALLAANAGVMGMAFLFNRVNPMIVYSSQYTVWVCLLSTWWIIAWTVLRGADAVRPTALARGYGFLQQWALWFAAMIGVTMSIGSAHIGSGYWVLVYYTGAFLAFSISLLEMAALPKKSEIEVHNVEVGSDHGGDGGDDGDVDEPATEETPLFRGPNRPLSFAPHRDTRYDGSHQDDADAPLEDMGDEVYDGEQEWSKDLPSWTWILQFLVTVPMQLILAGSVALLLGNALAQTGADGSAMLTVLVGFGAFSIILLLPVAPFLHRITYHVTVVVFLLLVCTGIYNLTTFPFSPNARLKVYFQQTVDLQTGENSVHLTGHPYYIEGIVSEYIPSAKEDIRKGRGITCQPDTLKDGLRRCSWSGPSPRVVPLKSGVPPEYGYRDWVHYNVSRVGKGGEALMTVGGRNTRACRLQFSKGVGIDVLGGRGHRDEGVTRELRLWSREWEKRWRIALSWNTTAATPGVDGTVTCLWSDANNVAAEIPALHEVQRHLPVWAIVSKYADGLVEGSLPFTV